MLDQKEILRKIGKNAQVTIPREFREYHGIKEGDTLHFVLTEYGVEIIPNKLTQKDVERALEESRKYFNGEKVEGVEKYSSAEELVKDLADE